MSNVAKLSLAVVLALAAAVLNAMWLQAEKQPATFVAAGADLVEGDEISDDLLVEIPVPGDYDTLSAALIPYEKRAILFGQKASRNYTQGDMFFQRDLKAPLETPQFEVLGPFRLISVGERFKQGAGEGDVGQYGSGSNNVTIAVSANFDDRTRRLLQIIDPNHVANRDEGGPRIIAVQVIPKEQSAAIQDEKDVVYQTVSLEGIENVPRVLLEGEVIRFVIPITDSL